MDQEPDIALKFTKTNLELQCESKLSVGSVLIQEQTHLLCKYNLCAINGFELWSGYSSIIPK